MLKPKNELEQKKKTVFLFSGQGSQFFHMGKELFEKDKVFKYWATKTDKLFIEKLGDSPINYTYNKNQKIHLPFKKIRYSHPALFIIEYALAMCLLEYEIKPDYLIGSSLGEISALTLADSITLNTAVNFISKQIELLENTVNQGAMISILDDYEKHKDTPIIKNNSDLAGINSNISFTLAGTVEKIRNIELFLRKHGILYQKLPLDYAFHSSMLDTAKLPILNFLKKERISPPKIPFISCATTEILNTPNAGNLWNALRNTIRSDLAIKKLEKNETCEYIDLSPASSFLSQIKNNSKNFNKKTYTSIITINGQDMVNIQRTIKKHSNKHKVEHLKQKQTLSFIKKEHQYLKNTCYMFPGQGSQFAGMGEKLFDEFKTYTNTASDLLGYSIKELCLTDKNQMLANTAYTQPALYTVNILTYLKKLQSNPKLPTTYIGHSLGEYCALYAAGAFSFSTGLQLVKKRGELMSQANGGKMAALLGLTEIETQNILHDNNLFDIDIANINSDAQIVLAGPEISINQAKNLFESIDLRFIPLNVSAPFHSRYMQNTMNEFENFIAKFTFNTLKGTVISNITTRPYSDDNIAELLTQQICGSVRWRDSIINLLSQNITLFEEIGPGTVLTKLAKQIIQSQKNICASA